MNKKIMAIDYGSKFIGVAVTDSLLMTAQGRPTIIRKNLKTDLNLIIDIILEDQIGLVIIGNPLSENGKKNPTSIKCEAFALKLKKKLLYSNRADLINPKPDIIMWSERFSTQDANLLLEECEIKTKDRKKYLDKLAAIMILESYLSRKKTGCEYGKL